MHWARSSSCTVLHCDLVIAVGQRECIHVLRFHSLPFFFPFCICSFLCFLFISSSLLKLIFSFFLFVHLPESLFCSVPKTLFIIYISALVTKSVVPHCDLVKLLARRMHVKISPSITLLLPLSFSPTLRTSLPIGRLCPRFSFLSIFSHCTVPWKRDGQKGVKFLSPSFSHSWLSLSLALTLYSRLPPSSRFCYRFFFVTLDRTVKAGSEGEYFSLSNSGSMYFFFSYQVEAALYVLPTFDDKL